MAVNRHIGGGIGETADGDLRRQAKALYLDVETAAAWNALTAADRWERIRKFIKYALIRWFL